VENDAFNRNVVVKSCLKTEVLEIGARVLEQPTWRERPKILDLELIFERISMTLNLDFECVPDCTVYQLLEERERCDYLIIDGTEDVSLLYVTIRRTMREDFPGYQQARAIGTVLLDLFITQTSCMAIRRVFQCPNALDRAPRCALSRSKSLQCT